MNRHLTKYFRFDPSQDLSQINPLDATRMADIETIVHDYVGGADVRDRLVQCANRLQVLLCIALFVLFSQFVLQSHRHRHSTAGSSRLCRMEPGTSYCSPLISQLMFDIRYRPVATSLPPSFDS